MDDESTAKEFEKSATETVGQKEADPEEAPIKPAEIEDEPMEPEENEPFKEKASEKSEQSILVALYKKLNLRNHYIYFSFLCSF